MIFLLQTAEKIVQKCKFSNKMSQYKNTLKLKSKKAGIGGWTGAGVTGFKGSGVSKGGA